MYNKLLPIFITVVEEGSFTKASIFLYMTPTAVMKNINSLEAHLGITLLTRTASGITPTVAGEFIYQEAKYIVNYSKEAIIKAKNLIEEQKHIIKIGTSILNPAREFMNLWYQIDQDFPNFDLEIIPFDDTHNKVLLEIDQIGKKFDFLIGVCDSKLWLSRCNMLTLGFYKKMIAVSTKHPLAKKKILEIEDLYDYPLIMVKQGDSNLNDILRADLTAQHPKIIIEDAPHFYDMSIFNECASTNKLLLILNAWIDVHPGLVSIPVNWSYNIPYGILYSKTASPETINIIKALTKKHNQGNL